MLLLLLPDTPAAAATPRRCKNPCRSTEAAFDDRLLLLSSGALLASSRKAVVWLLGCGGGDVVREGASKPEGERWGG